MSVAVQAWSIPNSPTMSSETETRTTPTLLATSNRVVPVVVS